MSAASDSSRPPCFADLAPSDFQLSRYLKELLCERAFEDDRAVVVAINEWIEEQDENLFCEGIKALQQRWEKCVDFQRNCV